MPEHGQLVTQTLIYILENGKTFFWKFFFSIDNLNIFSF